MKKNNLKIRSTGVDLVFDILNTTILVFVLVVIAYPLYFLILASFSSPSSLASGQVWFWPVGFNFDSYTKVLEYDILWVGYRNTIIYAVLSTVLGVSVTMMTAYPLAYSFLPGRTGIMLMFVFTMFFGGGLIPTYMTIQSLHLVNTPLVVIILGCFSVFNMIIARTFIQNSIPKELFEAAEIDGCGYGNCFVKIVLPLSKAIMAVLVIYIAVWQWNSYFNALIYISNRQYITLQLVLREILTSQQQMMQQLQEGVMNQDSENAAKLAESMKYAIVIIASLPIMLVYPFMQKYFVKGVFIGSIKG